MKFFVNLLLFVFLTFLSTPTIVSLIEKKCDTSIFYSMTEEEVHKEIKAAFTTIPSYELTNFPSSSSSLIVSENLSRHDNACSSIFIPPPDQA